MLIKKTIIFNKINSLRDSLIEKVKYVYDRQEHPKRDTTSPSESKPDSSKSLKNIQ